MANCQDLINWNKKETFHLGKFGLWEIINHIKDNTIYDYLIEDSFKRHKSHSKYSNTYEGDWNPELLDNVLRAKNLEKMILDFVGDDLEYITILDDGDIDSMEKCCEFKCVGDIYEWE